MIPRVVTVKRTVRERVKDELQERDEAIKACLSNEALTRERVEGLEKGVLAMAEILTAMDRRIWALEDWVGMPCKHCGDVPRKGEACQCLQDKPKDGADV